MSHTVSTQLPSPVYAGLGRVARLYEPACHAVLIVFRPCKCVSPPVSGQGLALSALTVSLCCFCFYCAASCLTNITGTPNTNTRALCSLSLCMDSCWSQHLSALQKWDSFIVLRTFCFLRKTSQSYKLWLVLWFGYEKNLLKILMCYKVTHRVAAVFWEILEAWKWGTGHSGWVLGGGAVIPSPLLSCSLSASCLGEMKSSSAHTVVFWLYGASDHGDWIFCHHELEQTFASLSYYYYLRGVGAFSHNNES